MSSLVVREKFYSSFLGASGEEAFPEQHAARYVFFTSFVGSSTLSGLLPIQCLARVCASHFVRTSSQGVKFGVRLGCAWLLNLRYGRPRTAYEGRPQRRHEEGCPRSSRSGTTRSTSRTSAFSGSPASRGGAFGGSHEGHECAFVSTCQGQESAFGSSWQTCESAFGSSQASCECAFVSTHEKHESAFGSSC